jgi:hypothetical protein
MIIEKDFPIILIVGGISLYFLATGIIALLKKRMTVVNPFAEERPLTIHSAIFIILKMKVEDDYKVPEGFIDRSSKTNLTGKDVLVRTWFHIIMGLIALFVLAAFLNPAIFEKIMNFID